MVSELEKRSRYSFSIDSMSQSLKHVTQSSTLHYTHSHLIACEIFDRTMTGVGPERIAEIELEREHEEVLCENKIFRLN